MTGTEDREPLDRDALRRAVRNWSSSQRRLLVERAVEHLRDEDLERLLVDLLHLDRFRRDPAESQSLVDRVADHVTATRRGDFLGDLMIRNRHGQREPEETRAWVAATSHLFDLAGEFVRNGGSDAPLRALVDLVEDVDERPDELVVFEDSCARDELPRSSRSSSARASRP